MMRVAFRCDGGARVGAGHVARCAQLARAFRVAGADVVFCGEYDGTAEQLVAAEGFETVAPADGPAGLPAGLDAAVVDSYEIPAAEIEAAVAGLPVAVVEDHAQAPRATAVIAYHVDAERRTAIPDGSAAVVGPRFAPIRPEFTTARRARGHARALVTAGGGEAGSRLISSAVEELLRVEGIEQVAVAAPGTVSVPDDPRVERRPTEPGEMLALVRGADLAVSAAGLTPYELACAGVPAVIVAVADNQLPVARAFDEARLAIGLDAPDGPLADAIGRLADASVRERLAAAGPAVVDGYGAFRARDAVIAAIQGVAPPAPLTYRPATPADSELLHRWRNDFEVRSVSRSTEPVAREEHDAWLASALGNSELTLLIVHDGPDPVGTVRFDREGDSAEISVTIAPGRRGGGLGTRAIREAGELELAARPELREIVAEVGERNPPSLLAFERAGFRRSPERRREGFVLLTLDRGGLRGLVH
jgi:spore coat polysaccharide biosynthesis predicted glycosyltransferase SpsG/RimJ/RimL family protein N-acetyltransferase